MLTAHYLHYGGCQLIQVRGLSAGALLVEIILQGVREKARVFETLNFFKRPDVAVLCVFSGNSCSMSATCAPSKALKVRPPAAKHYQLRHSCPLPKFLEETADIRTTILL